MLPTLGTYWNRPGSAVVLLRHQPKAAGAAAPGFRTTRKRVRVEPEAQLLYVTQHAFRGYAWWLASLGFDASADALRGRRKHVSLCPDYDSEESISDDNPCRPGSTTSC
ncbi:hypothetical protein MTO96_043727 [Rhipicephalus appendiculatus]